MAETIKIAELFPDRLDGLAAAAHEALCKDAEVAGQKLAWDLVSSRVGQALRQLLGCDLFDVLARGWSDSPVLRSYAAAMTEPSAKLDFGEHQLSRELNPTIAVTVGNCPCIELQFTVALAARFSGLRLEVTNRHITGGSPGAVSASAELSIGDVILHEAKSRELELPKRFSFPAPGIPISPPLSAMD
jgi:hypothetical protein